MKVNKTCREAVGCFSLELPTKAGAEHVGSVEGDGAKRPCGQVRIHRRNDAWDDGLPRTVKWRRESPARKSGRGLSAGFGLLAVRPAAAGPDKSVALGVLVLEEIGVDGRREARIVEVERKVVAALIGALRPGGPDLGAADKDPVARSVLADLVGLGDDANALSLDAQGDDLA